jgi:DNA polymerase V
MVLDTEEKIIDALRRTTVGDVWGVGGQSAHKLKEYWSIYDALQLRNVSEEFARVHLGGVTGIRLIKELKGEEAIDMEDELVNKKMIATTRMFGSPVDDINDIKEAVATYTSRVLRKN